MSIIDYSRKDPVRKQTEALQGWFWFCHVSSKVKFQQWKKQVERLTFWARIKHRFQSNPIQQQTRLHKLQNLNLTSWLSTNNSLCFRNLHWCRKYLAAPSHPASRNAHPPNFMKIRFPIPIHLSKSLTRYGNREDVDKDNVFREVKKDGLKAFAKSAERSSPSNKLPSALLNFGVRLNMKVRCWLYNEKLEMRLQTLKSVSRKRFNKFRT